MLDFLRTRRRNRALNPWHVARPLAELLAALAELTGAVGVRVDDDRWETLAAVLEQFAAELRRLS